MVKPASSTRRAGDQRQLAERHPTVAGHRAAHQGRRRNGTRAQQRQQGKEQRDQQAEGSRRDQRADIDVDARTQRQEVGNRRLRQEGQRRTDDHADHDTEQESAAICRK